ncbi:MAG: hypothetical protein QN157_08920 [Armatimonadota bacterium]|nr:hypothetical protein [Armatimonadota bacterium]
MVLGDDLDSVMCGVLMHHLFAWDVAGFYVDYHKVWYSHQISPRCLRNAVWLDLDVSRAEIRSIGHHILLESATGNILEHRESVNPNLFRGVTGRAGGGRARDHGEACSLCDGRTFPHKYPLGTIHFLLWLHNVDLGPVCDPFQEAFLWLPDSSWINGQRYPRNVHDWVRNWIPHPQLVATLSRIDTESFEETMRDRVFPAIERVGFTRGRGQVTSRHLGLGGYQCQFPDPNQCRDNLQALADLIADAFCWPRMTIPTPPYKLIEGRRNPTQYTLTNIRRMFGTLENFVRQERVFSYVIPNGGRINYTVDVDI